MVEKLRKVKQCLHEWNTSEFGEIDDKIRMLENKIQDLDKAVNERSLSDTEVLERKEAHIGL